MKGVGAGAQASRLLAPHVDSAAQLLTFGSTQSPYVR